MTGEGSLTPSPRGPRRGLRGAVRRHPWRTAVLVVGIALLLVVATLFNPDLQKRWLLPKLMPLAAEAGVERLEVDYLHLTPWSLDLRGVHADWRGLDVRVGSAEISFNPFGLLTDTVVVHALHVAEANVDLRHYRPPPPSPAPFAGVLSVLDTGYGIALYDVDVAARVQLDTARVMQVTVRGGDVRPHVGGALDYTLAYDEGEQHVDARGRLAVEQLSGGRFRRVQTELDARLAMPALPAPERVALTIAVKPAPGTGHLRSQVRERRAAGAALPPPPPETVTISVSSLDAAGKSRAKFDFDGLYRGEDGRLRGRYALGADNSLLAPYLGARPLPAFALRAQGALGVQTTSGAIDLVLEADTRLSALANVLGANAALPADLNLHSATTLALNGGRLVVTRFDHALHAASAAANPLVAWSLQGPVIVDLADPAALLATPRVLGTLALSAIPLPWINGLLPDQPLEGGRLDAAFELAVGDKSQLQLLPLRPTTLGEVTIRAGEEVLVPRLQLSLLPRLTRSDARVRLRLEELTVTDGDRQLLGGKLVLTQPLPPTADHPLRIAYDLAADVDALRALPPLAARGADFPLPDALRVKAKGNVDVRGTQLRIASLAASIAAPARPDLVKFDARQAFLLPVADAAFENPRGELATVALRGIELAWVSAFVPDIDLRGTLASADLLLTATGPGRLAVTATAPLRIDGLGVRLGDAAQLSDLRLVVTPVVDYGPQRVRFDLQQLNVATRNDVLVRGDLSGSVPLADGAQDPLGAEGRLEFDLTHLAAQPALRRMLGRAPPTIALDAKLDFAASRAGDTIHVARLAGELRAGRRARLELAATGGLDVRPDIGRNELLARHVVGDVNLKIRDLSSAVIKRFVALDGVAFAEINADLRLNSNGSVLRADSAAPLRIARVKLSDGDRMLLQPFTLGTSAALVVEGRHLAVNLADFALSFDGSTVPALSGGLAATLEPDRKVSLTRLATEFSAQLPQWLSQPSVMPGHKLSAGSLGARINVSPSGAIGANVTLEGLAASAPLALSRIDLPVVGAMAADGRGFSFTAPLQANGRSGTSNASVIGDYAPAPGKRGLLRLRVDSELFYLNDLLATVAAISPGAPPPPEAASETPAGPVAVDVTRDDKAAWDLLPYGARFDYRIGKLFYTDYLAFEEVTGKLAVRERKLSATEVAARFHDSQLRLNGTLDYRPAASDPYLLDVAGTVKDFNLNQFFKELVPGERPRIKGLFNVTLTAGGEMPNLGQLRNDTLFDVRMTSRTGVFRPLPPSSTLLASTSDVLGFVGEGLSYVPTGGFGAGTIARLVNYIARIDYDVVDIHVRRAQTRDVVIERFLVRSPAILITAVGGIKHVAGKDILDSPLELQANLDMSGRGAAILYSMGLLRDEKDDAGYWRGPEFKIWGTPAASESNFADLIRQASDGTVMGGITRPLSGLIGNIKYRWFGDDPKPLPPELAGEVEALEADEAAKEQGSAKTAPGAARR